MNTFTKLFCCLFALSVSGCVGLRPAPSDSIRLSKHMDPALSSSLEKGIRALLDRQHADDGSWGGDDVKVQSSHKSDYPVAISSLAYLALMTAAPADSDCARARRDALAFLLDTIEEGNMKNTRDNTPKVHERNVWSQGFGLFVFGHVLRNGRILGGKKAEMRAEARDMIRELGKTQQKDGGWTYDKGPSESFTTTTVLAGLLAIRKAGIDVPDHLVTKPLDYLKRQSNPGHYLSYQGIPKKLDDQEKVRDSIGRSVQLELVLLLAGEGSKEKLQTAIETFFKYRERFDKIRDLEKGCHQKPYMIGTFYIFYGYFYLAQALEHLGGETRDKYAPVVREHFLALQKPEGYWIDSRDHCGESYGTAMALLILTAPQWANSLF